MCETELEEAEEEGGSEENGFSSSKESIFHSKSGALTVDISINADILRWK